MTTQRKHNKNLYNNLHQQLMLPTAVGWDPGVQDEGDVAVAESAVATANPISNHIPQTLLFASKRIFF